MNPIASRKTHGILTYGSVELCLYQLYRQGEAIRVHQNLFIEVVDRVEKADGIVVLGQIPNEVAHRRPTSLCVLFTHYYRRPCVDLVDHPRTVLQLSRPSELVRVATERAFLIDLTHRSVTASLACHPSVRYL